MRFYRIPGRDRPVFLSDTHAELIDATPAEEDHPARNATTGVWRAWAALQGMDPDEAGKRSRTDLIATYLGEE